MNAFVALWCSFLVLFPMASFLASNDATEVIEYLEEGSHVQATQQTYMIKTNGHWDYQSHQKLTLSISSDVLSGEVLGSIIDNVTSAEVADAAEGHINWGRLLSSFHDSNVPSIEVVQGSADIEVVLTGEEHPEGKPGMARGAVTKDTREMVSAKVIVFQADKLYEDEILEAVLSHEIGHALGLSHSDDPESLMYPRIEMDRDSTSHPGSCELAGIDTLYVKSVVETVSCG